VVAAVADAAAADAVGDSGDPCISHTSRIRISSMISSRLNTLAQVACQAAAFLIIGFAAAVSPQQPPPETAAPAAKPQQGDPAAQVLFDSPQDAAVALIKAARHADVEALRAIIGPASDRLVSGDLEIDEADLERLAIAYDRKNTLIDYGNGTYTLVVGLQDWEFPAPIVGLNGKWWFDGEQGAEEVLNRVIGEHELRTISVCRKYPELQQAYFDMDPDGDGVKSYATKIRSTEGKRDGLYWPDAPGAPLSPIGPAVTQAQTSGELSTDAGKQDPYFGYFYRILTSQGAAAPGGAMNYIDDKGHMTRGFALIAWPASYGDSGVTTFIVAKDGIVYQRDLGENTIAEAAKITAYDPAGWTRVGDDDMPVAAPDAKAAP
jgi:hypothetical protein